MQTLTRALILGSVTLILAACGGDDPAGPIPPSGDADVSTDTAGDASADAGVDGGSDSGVDGGDTTGDTSEDPVADVVFDAEPDTPPGPTEFCEELTISGSERCEVTPGGSALLLRGDVLAPETVYEGGSVLIDDTGRIICAGCACADRAGDATVVTCPTGVISPGLVNGHDHLTFTDNSPSDVGQERFDHRHDWRRGIRGHTRLSVPADSNALRVSWGEMRQVMIGTTSVAGSGGAPGFLRNLDRSDDARELGQGDVDYDTFPLGDSGGELRTSDCSYPEIETPDVLDADCYLAHVAEGIDAEARNEFLCVSSAERGGTDLTESQSTFVHMIGLRAIDAAEAAAEASAVIWSPRSNISLYGHTAQITMFRNMGILVGIGTDWTASGSIHMGRELACADRLNRDHFGNYFDDRELWLMATLDTAAALKVDDVLGAISPGLVGDIAIYDGAEASSPYRAILEAQNENVMLVLRGGEPLYGEASVLDGIPGTEGCDEIPGGVCGMDARICVPAEVADSYSALASQNQFSYDAFFCGVPDGEPTCVPFRADEFDGAITPDDRDGDGIANPDDNCPRVFNPIRPIDEGVQANHDGDSVGDVCDPCPLEADTTDCAPPDPNDRDVDGIENLADNCPDHPNPGQEDADDDGRGDACDACPEESNPDGAACTFMIYDIKTGVVAEGTAARVVGQVTAMGDNRLFVQVPEADRDPELGAEFSGTIVFHGGSLVGLVERGDVIEVSGIVSTYFGQIQIAGSVTAEVLSSGEADPAPVVATAAELATGGALSDALEGVLVQVVDAEVTDAAPEPGGGEEGETNEFLLEDALRVNDQFYLTSPAPEVGEVLDVTGILQFHRANHKLEPRDAADVIFRLSRPPRLLAFESTAVYVLDGTDAGTPYAPDNARVALDRPAPEGGLVVSLFSSSDAIVVPSELVVPAGAYNADIPFTAATGVTEMATVTAVLDGTEEELTAWAVELTAEPAPISNLPAAPVTLVDVELPVEISFEFPAPPGTTAEYTVEIEWDGSTGESTIELPELTQEAIVFVSGDAVGTATVSVIGERGALEFDVVIAEATSTGLVLSEIFYDADTGSDGDSGWEWVELYNGTGAPIDLSTLRLGYGGGSYDDAEYALDGTVAPGGCFVVGGTSSDASNGSPVYDLARDFAPDIQNSGSRADAMGIFRTGESVPMDAVVYGGTNEDGFIGPDGEPFAEPTAPDVGAGRTIERTSEGWREQAAPTPGECAIAVE